MKINTNYGKLDGQNIEYGPMSFKDENTVIFNPTRETYLRHGYKLIVIENLDPKEGFHIEEDGYDETETELIKRFKYVENVDEEPSDQPTAPDPNHIRVFSKLYLKIALMKLGIWDQVLEWMEGFDIYVGDDVSINCLEAFNTAITLSDKFEGFSNIIQLAKTQFGLTDEQINSILDACETEG